MMQISHPNLAPVLGACTMGAHYVLYDNLPGPSLFEYLKRCGMLLSSPTVDKELPNTSRNTLYRQITGIGDRISAPIWVGSRLVEIQKYLYSHTRPRCTYRYSLQICNREGLWIFGCEIRW